MLAKEIAMKLRKSMTRNIRQKGDSLIIFHVVIDEVLCFMSEILTKISFTFIGSGARLNQS